MPMISPEQESALAAHLQSVLVQFESQPIGRRLRVRLKELGPNAHDEVAQFRQLQRACRESPELAAAFAAAGFGDFSTVDPRQPNPVVGAISNAFNRFVEARWR